MNYADTQMEWKPFGLSMTYEEFNELLSWYITKYSLDNLNMVEDYTDADKLYSKKFNSWTN